MGGDHQGQRREAELTSQPLVGAAGLDLDDLRADHALGYERLLVEGLARALPVAPARGVLCGEGS